MARHERQNVAIGFMNGSSARAQRRRKYDSLVTNAECERTQIPDAPLPVAGCGARLAGASSRFLLLTSLCGGKEK